MSPSSYSSPHQPPLTHSPYEPLTYFLQPRQSQHAFPSDPLFITESGTIASLMVPFPSETKTIPMLLTNSPDTPSV